MNPVIPHADLLRQLEARAQREGRSVDDLLGQMLSASPSMPASSAQEYLFQNISDPVIVLDVGGRILDCNPAALQQFGYDRTTLLQLNFTDLTQANDRERAVNLLSATAAQVEILCQSSNGNSFPMELRVCHITHAGNPAVLVMGRDIGAEMAAKTALRQSEEHFRQVVESILEVFWLQDAATRKILYISPGYQRIWGKPTSSVFDETMMSMVASLHEDDRERISARLKRMFDGEMFDDEFRVVRPDGSVRWVHAQTFPVRDLQGKVYRYAGVAEDITRQHEVARALYISKQEARSLIESRTTYVIRTDMVGNYTFVNRAFTRRFGWKVPGGNFIGTSSLDTIYKGDHTKTYEVVAQCMQEPNIPVPVLLRKDTQDGNFFWTLWEFVCLTDETGIPTEIQCVGVDATELIRAREQLQLQGEALQAAANAIIIITPQGMIEWANPAFTALTGYSLSEAQGKSINMLRSGVHDDTFYKNLWDTILAGRMWQGRIINRRKDGSLYTEDQTITPIKDDTGAIRHFVSIKEDVTALKQAEELRLEQERLKASLQKEREQIALNQRIISTLSHDLRTSLAVISASRDTLANYYHRLTDDRRIEKLSIIGNQTRFAMELLDETVLMARGNQEQMRFRPHLLNLAALCEISVNEMQQTTGNNHQLRFVTDGQISHVQADETLISRILLNLLSNAIKFSPAGGEIRLELARNENHIQIQVVDQGMGIDALDQEHIFEPFYRSDSAKTIRGTGLGLSIVYDCVVRHGGEVRVQSELGSGTTFIVQLPLVNA